MVNLTRSKLRGFNGGLGGGGIKDDDGGLENDGGFVGGWWLAGGGRFGGGCFGGKGQLGGDMATCLHALKESVWSR